MFEKIMFPEEHIKVGLLVRKANKDVSINKPAKFLTNILLATLFENGAKTK